MKLSKEDKKQFALCSHSRTHNRHFRERERWRNSTNSSPIIKLKQIFEFIYVQSQKVSLKLVTRPALARLRK